MMSTLFDCPGVPDYGVTHRTRTGDYGVNGSGLSWNATSRYQERLFNIKKPFDLILQGENRLDTSGAYTVDLPNPAEPDRLVRRHHDGGNYTWHDGHWKMQQMHTLRVWNKLPWFNATSY